jgi:hypothetical protein
MKKFLPLILLAVGILVVVVVIVLVKHGKSTGGEQADEDTGVIELAQSQWPAVSLIPADNPKVAGSLGHWLNFKVEKINVAKATSMDYELVYSTSNNIQQGVPGTVKLTAGSVERALLLGSESSGKYRYDAGVELGTMTLKFRDAKGKLIGRLITDFHLQFEAKELTSADGSFKYTLDKAAKGVYFVTMKTFLEPKPSDYLVVFRDGYAVFSSDGKPHAGSVR